jgi:hypothetical protein
MTNLLLVLATISEHLYTGVWSKDVQDRMGSTIQPVIAGAFSLRNYDFFYKDVRQQYSAAYVVRATLGMFGLINLFRSYPTKTTT